jgi:hypothetical protein
VLQLVKNVDPSLWREMHESLRFDAARLDENSRLYILLRSANWEKREKLKGHISGALWIRQLAEVLRRGFEKFTRSDRRKRMRHSDVGGLERVKTHSDPRALLDDPFRSKSYVAYHFGLFTGSAVRWYVAGETEYYAFSHLLPETSKFGVELKNLKGIILSRDRNAALKIEAMLRDDKAQRRFSIVSFDRDKSENLEFIQRQVKEGNIVGLVAAHDPNFESGYDIEKERYAIDPVTFAQIARVEADESGNMETAGNT